MFLLRIIPAIGSLNNPRSESHGGTRIGPMMGHFAPYQSGYGIFPCVLPGYQLAFLLVALFI